MFRVIVPVLKVESIIGRNGDLIKKICEETKAHIRVLEDPVCNPDRIVLISGKEEIEAPLSPAMDVVIRLFKHVNGFPENGNDGEASTPFCSIRLLVPSMQATSLFGKQGSRIKAIQENTGCSVRILSCDEVSSLSANSDDRVVDLQGEALKVLQALEAVLKHLRMFLVDHSILPLFQNTHNATTRQEQHQLLRWAEKFYIHTATQPQRESMFLYRGPHLESRLSSSGCLFFGLDPGLPTTCSPGFSRTAGPFVTQANSGLGGAFFRPVVLNTPTFYPLDQTALCVDQKLTGPGPARSHKKRHRSALLPPHVAASQSGEVTKEAGPLVPPIAATETPQKEPIMCSSMVKGPPELPQLVSLETESASPHFGFSAFSTRATGFTLFGASTFSGSGLFGSTSTSTIGTSTIFGASSISTTTSAVSSGLFGSLSPTPSFSSAGSSPTVSISFADVTTSTGLQSSSGLALSLKPASTTVTTTNNTRKTRPCPAFGVPYSSSSTTATGSDTIFASPTTTRRSSPFLGFHFSSKTVAAATPSSQPQSIAASSLCGEESLKPLVEVPLVPKSALLLFATQTPQKEPLIEVPPEMPQVQPATAVIETKHTMSVFEKKLLVVLKMIADKMNKPHTPSKPTFEDCEKKLTELGWPKDDPLHEVAFPVFCENDRYRECWMKLNPERCVNWVRMIGRSKRFL